ncbi:MAG: endonuclease/exonuclease/phosphatase family protein [Pirellulales bacterium]
MRILSYNIHKGIGGQDRRYDLERVIRVIEAAAPDIICLQEVDRHVPRSRHDDQPRLLAEYFRAAGHLFQLNVHLKEGGYGNLLLSRWPIKHKHQISLRLATKKPRGAQMAVINTPDGDLHVTNWHLGLAEQERQWQARHLMTHSLFNESSHLPTVVIGDFNDWRNMLVSGALGRAGFQQVTAPISRFRSFPAFWAMGSLDKAYVRGEIAVQEAHIIRTRLAKQASDHLPLVVDLELIRENGFDLPGSSNGDGA